MKDDYTQKNDFNETEDKENAQNEKTGSFTEHSKYATNKMSSSVKNKEEKEKGFDYSLLHDLINKSDKTKKNAILLSTGSYNPIHRMHLEIFNIAYKHLLSKNEFNVLCAFISPSADCYVRHKKPPLIPFYLRCEMIKTAIEEYQSETDLKIFLHTWEGSQDTFRDFPEVINTIQDELNNYKITLFYVCGLDLFSKCRSAFYKNVIAVDRKPYKKFVSDIPNRNIYIVPGEKTEPFSSTEIRNSFRNNQEEEIKKMTFPKVADMVIKFYKDNFII